MFSHFTLPSPVDASAVLYGSAGWPFDIALLPMEN